MIFQAFSTNARLKFHLNPVWDNEDASRTSSEGWTDRPAIVTKIKIYFVCVFEALVLQVFWQTTNILRFFWFITILYTKGNSTCNCIWTEFTITGASQRCIIRSQAWSRCSRIFVKFHVILSFCIVLQECCALNVTWK